MQLEKKFMDKLFLVKPSVKHKKEYEEMMEEWERYGGRLHPGALRNYSDKQMKKVTFEEWLNWIEEDGDKETCPSGTVPQDLYFLVNEKERILGAITIRHYLNERIIKYGGHFGIGIRPSERLKGYATKIIGLGLLVAKKEYEIKELLYTCDKDNIGSAKAIINNGGIFLGETIGENGNIIQRFSLEL
jgi:predicted acetyltransferase